MISVTIKYTSETGDPSTSVTRTGMHVVDRNSDSSEGQREEVSRQIERAAAITQIAPELPVALTPSCVLYQGVCQAPVRTTGCIWWTAEGAAGR